MMPTLLIFLVALLSAALMGLAIQRGGTCMVAAVDQVVRDHRIDRAAALIEAAIWVGGLVTIAIASGWLVTAPEIYPVTGWTISGGLLLGLGAYVNSACVFGSIARIGSGEWAYLATPLGFFLGCLVPIDATASGPQGIAGAGLDAGAIFIMLVFVGLAVRRTFEAARSEHLGRHLWHPHRATLLIAITFVIALLSVGAWAYTDALAAIARSTDAMLSVRGLMVLALLTGAIAGGALAGKMRLEAPRLVPLVRCLTGGMLMGIGAALVPGSNDGLILLGLPGFAAHAWVAVTVMTLTLVAAIKIETVTRRVW